MVSPVSEVRRQYASDRSTKLSPAKVTCFANTIARIGVTSVDREAPSGLYANV